MRLAIFGVSFFMGCALFMLFGSATLLSAEEAPQAKGDKSADWGFKVGGDERFRYEYRRNFNFDKGVKDSKSGSGTGNQFFNRLRLNAKASFGKVGSGGGFEAFVEGLDGLVGSYQMKPMSSQKDAFDLHQLYAAAYNILRSGFDVKAGRQEMKYGAGRLVWAPTWANRIRSFDSVVLRYRHEGLYGDALYGYDVKYNDNNFNRMQHYERLMGVYAGYQKDKASMLIEGYLLRQNINSSGKLRRYTAGARAQGRMPGDILCDIEFPYQFGKTNAGKIIRAYALHIDASRAFASVLWQPTVMLEYNEATGDKEPNDRQSNTFIPLYQSTHEPYGLMDFFRWENMREAALNVSLSPAKKLKFTPQTNFFWLMSTNDSWYDSTGTAFRTKTTGRRSHYVGQEISLRAAYDFNKNIKLEVGAAHFFTGRYVQQSGPNNDADWIYSQIYFKF